MTRRMVKRKGASMNEMRIGAAGGTICSLWASFSVGHLLETVIIALVGTLVSMAVSRLFSVRKKE